MKLISSSRVYIFITAIVISAGLVFILFIDKLNTHLYINSFNLPFLDVFFSFMTRSVELVSILLLLVLALLKSYRIAVTYILSFSLVGIVTQFLKRIVFSEHRRPYYYFKDNVDFHVVEGIKMLQNFSFPSGHSSTALCMYFILALILEKPRWQILCAVLALLTAMSRVYLSQHFLNDIIVGSALGLLITIGVNAYVQSNTKMNERLRGSLMSTFSRLN